MNASVVLFANAGPSIKYRFAPGLLILLPAMSSTPSTPAKKRDVRLWLLMHDPGNSNFDHRGEGCEVTDVQGFVGKWILKAGICREDVAARLAGSYHVPKTAADGTHGYSCVEHQNHNVAEVANAAIRAAIAECPADAPYALAFIGMTWPTSSILAQRDQIAADWRALFAAPKPEPSVIQAYIAATKDLETAKSAVACAVERAQLEAKQVTTKGMPPSFDISSAYLDALCVALEHPGRVYRSTPRRADMLRRLGLQVDVVYKLPEAVYLAQAPNSRDTELRGDLYIRLGMPF